MDLDDIPIEDQTARKRALDEKRSKAKEQKNNKTMV